MLQFDKVKIISTLDKITIIDFNAFHTIIQNGVMVEHKFTMASPFLLKIKCNYLKNELVIEFTGKILRDDYHLLINKHTFKQCLKNINDLQICILDIDAIYDNDYFSKLDVNHYVQYANCHDLTQRMKSNISNYNKYVSRLLQNGNFIIEKNVTTKQYKKRLTIYDKYKEILRTENKPFLNSLGNKNRLMEHLEGKVNIELNLNSMEQIRQSLKISDTNIRTVINSDSNPIRDFIEEIVTDDDAGYSNTSKSEYLTKLVLADNDYDLEKVEAKMRQLHSKGSNISKVMKPYRMFLGKQQSNNTSLKRELLDMLSPDSK